MEVLVFSTSVQSMDQVKTLAPEINSLAGKGHWNFALDDCDKILRIVSDKVKAQQQRTMEIGYSLLNVSVGLVRIVFIPCSQMMKIISRAMLAHVAPKIHHGMAV